MRSRQIGFFGGLVTVESAKKCRRNSAIPPRYYPLSPAFYRLFNLLLNIRSVFAKQTLSHSQIVFRRSGQTPPQFGQRCHGVRQMRFAVSRVSNLLKVTTFDSNSTSMSHAHVPIYDHPVQLFSALLHHSLCPKLLK